MLSKKQAKIFFLAGTIIFSVLFLGLSFDTVANRVGPQTHEENLTEEVVRGREIWDKNNCMGCHTLLGEGAYYAPELTLVYERRGPEWMKMFLKDPQKMYPGERKMVQYDFTDQEIDDLISFFKWIGEMDLNGFPAKTMYDTLKTTAGNDYSGLEKPSNWSLCQACHSVGGNGGNVGPALDGIGSRQDEAYLVKWMKDPQAVKPGTTMPKIDMSDAEFNEVIAYLVALK